MKPIRAFIPKGRKTFYVNYKQLSGKSINKPVGKDIELAHKIAAQLTALRDKNHSIDDINPNDYESRALEIHFGFTPDNIPRKAEGPTKEIKQQVIKDIETLSAESKNWLIDLMKEHANQAAELAVLRPLADELKDIKRTIEGQRAASRIKARTIDEDYKKYLEYREFKKHSKRSIKEEGDIQEEMIETLKAANCSITLDLTEDNIFDAIMVRQNNHKGTDKVYHYNKSRTLIGKFINWVFKKAKILSPMKNVDKMKEDDEDANKDIFFHSYKEVTDALKNIEDNFWKTIVATYAFCGLRRSELIQLRTCDIDQKNWIISIVPHHDGSEQQSLKRRWTKRKVPIPDKLIPFLKQYIKDASFGNYYFFPAPYYINPKCRHTEKIDKQYISNKFRKILPDNMTAASLRRTAGSFIVETTKSFSVASKILGNSAAVCEEHYCMILTENQKYSIPE